MQHIVLPGAILMELLVRPDEAFINDTNTTMFTLIDGNLHILTGDFEGIDTGTDLVELVQRNLK